MALFDFFNTRELEEFANGLATDLGRRFPPASESRTDTGAIHQLKVIMEGLSARAVRYHEQHRLGVYKKAKLANVFKWKLTELGYSKSFIERASKEIGPGRAGAVGGRRRARPAGAWSCKAPGNTGGRCPAPAGRKSPTSGARETRPSASGCIERTHDDTHANHCVARPADPRG